MHSFSAAIFLSAFLIFSVQPVVGKFILPWFGASPGVWATCLLFFQLALLTGYWYAHLLARKILLHHQPIIHCALLLISIILLQVEPSPPADVEERSEVFTILIILLKTTGLPFMILAASAPLLQHWYSHKNHDRSPYHLYALSNFGSLLALLGYPLIFEPTLTLEQQTSAWSIGYLIFFAITAICACQIGSYPRTPMRASKIREQRPDTLKRLSWIAHAALGTTLLISITNQASLDISANPLIWTLPLSLYLLSFIVTFSSENGYRRALWIPLAALSIGLLMLFWHESLYDMSLHYKLLLYLFALFTCCMICHGELVKQKPPTQHLTSFYLDIAAGGAIGGIAINLIAPLVFDHHWELQLALLFTIVLATIHIYANTEKRLVKIFTASSGTLVIAILTFITLYDHFEINSNSLITSRSFYGVLQVEEYDQNDEYNHHRSLYHGNIVHGSQFLRKDLQKLPTTYYGHNSGIGVAFLNYQQNKTSNPNGRLKVGAIGLGAGVVATYGKRNDYFIFYEINEDVYDLARDYFYYMENSAAEIQVIIGDGRMRLAEEFRKQGSHQFDLLIVDAFSGDAIPTHLLTAEAMELYLNHLKPDGLLALHITNFNIDLTSISRTLAKQYNKQALLITNETKLTLLDFPSDWVIITSNSDFLNDSEVRAERSPWPAKSNPTLWTDSYINLLSVIK